MSNNICILKYKKTVNFSITMYEDIFNFGNSNVEVVTKVQMSLFYFKNFTNGKFIERIIDIVISFL